VTVEAERIDEAVRVIFCPVLLPIISTIHITGNAGISREEILTALELQEGDHLPLEEDSSQEITQRLLTFYRTRHYHQAQAETSITKDTDPQRVVLVIRIREDPPSTFGTITFRGETVFSEKQLIQTSRLRGKLFDLEQLEQAVERVKQLYAEKGYLEVELTDEDLQYNIETGDQSSVDPP
jgi:outer membrane protein assembly factor BamA